MGGRVREILQFGIGSFQQFGMPGDLRGCLLLRPLGFPSLRDIPKYEYHADDASFRGSNGCGAVVNRKLTAILSSEVGAIGKADGFCIT
jgi:hypothetical protein